VEHTTHTHLENEAAFGVHEIFFSITEHDSTILSGNEVFVQISGYTKEELTGRYHNLVRHPDMPRILFKTLWEYLQAEKPIVAYVKNRTKEGDYYWVLAAVFPSKSDLFRRSDTTRCHRAFYTRIAQGRTSLFREFRIINQSPRESKTARLINLPTPIRKSSGTYHAHTSRKRSRIRRS
jgi:PAS domain S-box-containing protein